MQRVALNNAMTLDCSLALDPWRILGEHGAQSSQYMKHWPMRQPLPALGCMPVVLLSLHVCGTAIRQKPHTSSSIWKVAVDVV